MQRIRTLSSLGAGLALGAGMALAGALPAQAAADWTLEDDSATTTVDTTIDISTADNDSFPLGGSQHDWLDYLQNPTEQGGTVQDLGYGQVRYTPPLGFTGTDTFVYGRTDNEDLDYSDRATVTITVTADDDPAVPMIAPGIAAVGLLGSGALLGARRLRGDKQA